MIDTPRDVRAGEELDAASLSAWLGKPVTRVLQYPRGHSNLTYLIDDSLVLRRPPFGSQVKSAHDMGREARILTKLHPVFPKAPEVVAVCDDLSVLGAPFYLMKPVRGTILRGPAPRDFQPTALAMRALCLSFVQTLAELHAIDWRKAGLEGKPEGFVQRQVDGWTKRWHDAKTSEVPAADAAARWIAERVPLSASDAFLHNDYKFDNIVLNASSGISLDITGVLDWELSAAGDPLIDLGSALGYWIEETDPEPLKAFAFGPTFLPGALTRRELADEYQRLTGRSGDLLFYYVFALFKIAVIAQQIYKRYVLGLTQDERFAALGMAVELLAQSVASAISRQSL